MPPPSPPTAGTGKRLLRSCLLGVLVMPALRADITYTLQFNPSSSPEAQEVADSVAAVAAFYNTHGSFNKHWDVHYDPAIPTAQAGYSGYMGYGGTRNERVVFHEAAHTFGMGTTSQYQGLISGGVWTGPHGNEAQFDTYNHYQDGLHGDSHAIWPGGFNYNNEDGFIERYWHIRVMSGIRADMGILSYTKEAENELVHPGETAEFRVTSPVAVSYQWYKDGSPLLNVLDISGATSAVLQIANAEAADEGSYHCEATGGGETLASRPRQLWVDPPQQLVQLDMENNVTDSSGRGNHGTAFGIPLYTAGQDGQAIDLDGLDDYIELPDAAVVGKNLTVATWVNWDGGGNWQRLFDFGTGQFQYLSLTPQSGDGTLRLALRDAINGMNAEQQVNTTALTPGVWTHLAVVLDGDQATLYMSGSPVGSIINMPIDPTDFEPTQCYLGKSQFNDPLFDGRIDDFRIYNHALTAGQIWDLAGQTGNNPPLFDSATIALPGSTEGEDYADTGITLADHASDADGEPLTFTKLNGPGWLNVASGGALSGTPGPYDAGDNSFFVRVSDPSGASSQAEIQIDVIGIFPPTPIAYWTFEEGTADTYVPYGPGSPDQYDGSVLDVSGYGNHLSAWDENWHWYRSNVPSAITPQTGAANSLSLQNANGTPALTAIGTPLSNWSPSEWTIEAAIRPDDATGPDFQSIVGRDSQGSYPADPRFADLYFSVTPQGALRIIFNDAAGNNWALVSAANVVQDAKWHAVAARSDGATLSLYLKNLTDGDPAYTLLGTLDISTSPDPALHTGTGDGVDWDPGVFTVGRGLWNGSHVNRFIGHLDEVRLFGRALAPEQFLYSTPTPPAPPTGLTATGGDNSVSLDWADNGEPDFAYYTVYRSTTSGSGYLPLATELTTSSFLDSTALNNTTYYYVVTASDTFWAESLPGAEASATPLTPLQAWRLTHFGTTDNSGNAADQADPDGDGFTNEEEFTAGTDPNDPASYFFISAVEASGNDLLISFPTVSGKIYGVERSDSLLPGSWALVLTSGTPQENLPGTGATLQVTDTNGALSPKLFYRAEVRQGDQP